MSELEIKKCPECEEMQKSHKDYCIWCSNYKDGNSSENSNSSVIKSMDIIPNVCATSNARLKDRLKASKKAIVINGQIYVNDDYIRGMIKAIKGE